MQPQFDRAPWRPLAIRDIARAATLISIGLFRKIVLADNLSPYADRLFSAAQTHQALPFLDALIGTLSFGLQIYFDFSGYSDMAIGLAALFGVNLPLNFASPYKARSIIEFWRTWHMTLSRFLRDYLYIPLGGNRFGHSRRYANLIATMVLGGLWHGAAWTFALWGLLARPAMAAALHRRSRDRTTTRAVARAVSSALRRNKGERHILVNPEMVEPVRPPGLIVRGFKSCERDPLPRCSFARRVDSSAVTWSPQAPSASGSAAATRT